MPDKAKTEIIERVKNEGLVNGDILVYDNDSYGLLTEDDIIFVGIDSNTFYDFEFVKEATKYTTNFFSKYKDLLKFRNIPFEADLFTWHNDEL